MDLMIIAPSTGNTLAKLVNSITDTTGINGCKAHLRNQRPLLLAIATNDGLGNNGKNIGSALNMKNVYMVPFRQDDPVNKPNSLVANMEKILDAALMALKNTQIQPIIIEGKVYNSTHEDQAGIYGRVPMSYNTEVWWYIGC